jgi:polysaccharide pyruvyl transferase WcaK-like protein
VRKIVIFVLLVFLVASFCISVHHDGGRTISPLIPFSVLEMADGELRNRVLEKKPYVALDSEAELERLNEFGLKASEVGVCNVYDELPSYLGRCRAVLLSALKERTLHVPEGIFPEKVMVLAFELAHFSGSSPERFSDFEFHWVHRFFSDEMDITGTEREMQRWKRAFRERSLRFFFIEPGVDIPNSVITADSVFAVRWQELCRLFDFDQYSPVSPVISGLWRYIFSVLILLTLAFLVHWAFVYPLIFIFFPFPVSVQAAAFSFQLFSVFFIYKKLEVNSRNRKWPWFLLVLPLQIFVYSLFFGGLYYFMLSWPEFQQRIYLPRGVKIALFAPFMVILLYEMISFFRQEGFKKGCSKIFALRFMFVFLLGAAFLALLLIRSGNQTILPIAEFELNVREFLENVLIARPRTRELFFYAGLICFVPAVKRSSFFWLIIGKSSLILLLSSTFNTFSHLHTPWWLVVLRTFNAFWISSLFLFVICFLLMHIKKRSGILHLGYFGFGNFGDELLRLAVQDKFAGEKNVFIAGPLVDEESYGENLVYRHDFTGLLEKSAELEIFSLGPGGILQDKTSFFSLLYYLFSCWFFRFFCGLRVFWTGQGISPFRYRISGWLVWLTAGITEKIIVRDPESSAVLKALGVREHKISVEKDLVFDLSLQNSDSQLESAGSGEKTNSLAIVLRTWEGFNPQPFLQQMAKFAFNRRYYLFQAEPGLEKLIRDFDPDSEICVFSNNIEAWLYDFRQNAGVISMRYHGLVLGLRAGLPVLPLIYDQKCLNLVHEYQLSEYLTEEDWENRAVLEKTIGSFLQKLQLFPEKLRSTQQGVQL